MALRRDYRLRATTECVWPCEQASKQLISHYKGEAERLLTMSQKSKAVAKSNRAEMMEREVNKPHRYHPWDCEGAVG